LEVTRADRILAGAAALLVALGTFTFHQRADVAFTGDEPHYAVYAQSLGRGWGVDLERAYRAENVDRIKPDLPDEHAKRYRGEDGRYVTWHGPGLALLLAPALALSPTAWTARYAMVLLTALLAYHLVLLVRRVARCSTRVAALASAILLLAPPALVFGELVYPEAPATLFVVLALRAGLAVERRGHAVAASAAAGFLLLLNLRYAALMVGVLALLTVAEVRRRHPRSWGEWWRAAAPLLVPAGVIGLGLLVFDYALFGRSTPPPVYTPSGSFEAPEYYRVDNLYFYGVGALIGFPDGIVPLAPVLLAPLVALPLAVRRVGAGLTVMLAASGAYVLGNAFFGSPGFSAPGRYVTTVVPLLAVPFAVLLSEARNLVRAGIGVLVALTALSVATFTTDANQVFSKDRSGIEPINHTAGVWPFIIEDRRPASTEQPPDEIRSLTGSLEEGVRVARAGRDEAGTVAYGPNLYMKPGRYVATFTLANPTRRSAGVTAEVAADVNRRITAADLELEGGDESTVVRLPFTTNGTEDLELRVFWDGQGAVAVRSIRADQIEAGPGRDPEEERWKAVWWIAAIAGAGIELRRRATIR
jgi:hypothetical protein